jgi:acyl dehydratase
VSAEATTISEQALADLRAEIGRKRPVERAWNRGAGRDNLSHFAEGIGDLNPLWVDRDHGAASPWGAIQAPPTFVLTMGSPFASGLSGAQGFYGGSELTRLLPIYLGDRISATVELVELSERESRHAGRMFRQVERMEFTNQLGQLVATADHWALRYERESARQRAEEQQGRYQDRQLSRYTAEGIKGIDAEYARERGRGAEPLYWEEVRVGEYLPQIVKGPLRLTDIICYMMGGGSSSARGHRVSWEFRRDHPDDFTLNPQGVPDTPEASHWEPWLAERASVPGIYDSGRERLAWMGHCLTNWIGDHGWVERLRGELRGVNLVGDTTRVSALVTEKRVERGRHLVELEVWCANQLGEVTAKGEARVRLPGREAGDPGAAPELALATRKPAR